LAKLYFAIHWLNYLIIFLTSQLNERNVNVKQKLYKTTEQGKTPIDINSLICRFNKPKI